MFTKQLLKYITGWGTFQVFFLLSAIFCVTPPKTLKDMAQAAPARPV
jgi:hypothetical protein